MCIYFDKLQNFSNKMFNILFMNSKTCVISCGIHFKKRTNEEFKHVFMWKFLSIILLKMLLAELRLHMTWEINTKHKFEETDMTTFKLKEYFLQYIYEECLYLEFLTYDNFPYLFRNIMQTGFWNSEDMNGGRAWQR